MLREAQQALDMGDVHDTIDTIYEQTEISKEISEAARGMGSNQHFDDDDDDELTAELESWKGMPFYGTTGLSIKCGPGGNEKGSRRAMVHVETFARKFTIVRPPFYQSRILYILSWFS